MTNKEKMTCGLPYYLDDKLLEDLRRAQELLREYNQTAPRDTENRQTILKLLIPESGQAGFEPPFRCDYGYPIQIGEDFFANYGCTILDGGGVFIGNHVRFGPNVSLYTAIHPMDAEERRTGLETAKPIWIGDDSWLCGSVTVIGGVKIGKRCVIGSGSVVTRDVPDNCFAAGNPARVIRKI